MCPMIFQSLMGSGKSSDDVPNGLPEDTFA
jgi:hypothetical protein